LGRPSILVPTPRLAVRGCTDAGKDFRDRQLISNDPFDRSMPIAIVNRQARSSAGGTREGPRSIRAPARTPSAYANAAKIERNLRENKIKMEQ